MSKPLIIKCNRMFPDIIIEQYRQDIMKKMEDGVVILPPGFEIAEVNVELLEQIKEEIKDLDLGFFDEDYRAGVARGVMEFNKILNKHITTLKGE